MQRLKTRTQFQAVLAGQTIARTAHFALHRVALDAVAPVPAHPAPSTEFSKPLFDRQGVWMGAMVPKRWAKRAVTRNAIKRQIYNVSSSMELKFHEMAHVVRLRAGFNQQQFVSASSDSLKVAVKLELIQLFGDIAVPGCREALAKI